MNQIILLFSAGMIVGSAIYLVLQCLRMRSANKVLGGIVGMLRANGGPTGSWDALCAVGDCLAHQLSFNDHPELLSRWWELRGGHEKCTVCRPGRSLS